MAYVDGFVLAVPKKNIAAYRRMARAAGKIWREFGAIDYRECVADDVKGASAKAFSRCARPKRSEVVLFSWIVYKTKADRNRVNAKIMKDPRIAKMMDPSKPVFDMKRMAYGGFKSLVAL